MSRTIRPAPSTTPLRRLLPDYEAPAPRQLVPYHCGRGHEFTVTFAAGVEPPAVWECRCGSPAALAGAQPAAPPVSGAVDRRGREHGLDLVLQRRSRAELERLLCGRLAELAATREPPGGAV